MNPESASVFEYADYRAYLTQRFGGKKRRTGLRMAAAKAIRCHTTYLSQVLNHKVDLSLEQAIALNEFLAHSEDEGHYFLLLLQKERAGSEKLKSYFEKQLSGIRENRTKIKTHLRDTRTVSEQDQARFYSSWIYTAIHVLTSIPTLQTREALARHLQLPISVVTEVLEFLLNLGMVKEEKGRYQMGESHFHLPGDSYLISKHHTNWRMKAISSLDGANSEDLHYSAVVTLSAQDAQKIKDELLRALKRNVEIIEKSPAAEAYVYNFDFFRL